MLLKWIPDSTDSFSFLSNILWKSEKQNMVHHGNHWLSIVRTTCYPLPYSSQLYKNMVKWCESSYQRGKMFLKGTLWTEVLGLVQDVGDRAWPKGNVSSESTYCFNQVFRLNILKICWCFVFIFNVTIYIFFKFWNHALFILATEPNNRLIISVL